MNFQRIYEYRFQGVNTKSKVNTWKEISSLIQKNLSYPEKIIDPAAGMCEFINSVNAKEKWAVDLDKEFLKKHCNTDIKMIGGNCLHVDLPENYFDGVFVSNFLEHLNTQDEVAIFLTKMNSILKKGGMLAIMGPNFKYAYKNYFDFADHKVILTELGLAEHIFGAGFNVLKVHPKFLPLTFRSKLPPWKILVKIYLKFPLLWKLVGKQFLLVAQK